MATLDVSGRVMRETHGKARPKIRPENCLVGSDFGLMPHDGHPGKEVAPTRCRSASPLRPDQVLSNVNSLAPADAPRGKKHVDLVHQTLSDDFKRQTGRIGLKKVIPPHQSPRPASASESASGRERGVERMRLCTAEQQARRRLDKVALTHPELREKIAEGAKTGGDVLVELEKKIQKQLLLEEARRYSRSVTPDRPRSADLGAVTLSTAPFAYDGAAPLSTQARISTRKTFRAELDSEKGQQLQAPSRFSKKRNPAAQPPAVPFDTALVSTVYPNPPEVGAAAKRGPQGKGHIAFTLEPKNIDEELQRKAVARCHFSAKSASTANLFREPSSADNRVDGGGDTTRRLTLRETQEARVKERESKVFSTRVGKQMSEEKYKSTALW